VIISAASQVGSSVIRFRPEGYAASVGVGAQRHGFESPGDSAYSMPARLCIIIGSQGCRPRLELPMPPGLSSKPAIRIAGHEFPVAMDVTRGFGPFSSLLGMEHRERVLHERARD
jgi:hypothetical protein